MILRLTETSTFNEIMACLTAQAWIYHHRFSKDLPVYTHTVTELPFPAKHGLYGYYITVVHLEQEIDALFKFLTRFSTGFSPWNKCAQWHLNILCRNIGYMFNYISCYAILSCSQHPPFTTILICVIGSSIMIELAMPPTCCWIYNLQVACSCEEACIAR